MSEEPAYQIEIQFNGEANLVNVNHPPEMDLPRLGEHLAVALQFVCQEMGKQPTITHSAIKD